MTAIAIYRFPSETTGKDELWAIGDTRITSFSAEGSFVGEAISCGTKIFTLPLKVNDISRLGNSESVIDTTIGVAYAGNATLGLNLHAMLSQILQSLTTVGDSKKNCISIREISEFSANVLTTMIQEINRRHLKWKQIAEFAVFGFCPAEDRLVVYRSKIVRENGLFRIRAVEATPENPFTYIESGQPECLLLGDKKAELQELIRARLEDAIVPGVNFQDIKDDVAMAPKYVLEAMIHHEVFETIGNGLQIVVADSKKAQALLWQRPQSIKSSSDEYEMYSLFNISVLENMPSIGQAAVYHMPSVQAHYKVDLRWDDHISEFQQALRRQHKSEEPLFIFKKVAAEK